MSVPTRIRSPFGVRRSGRTARTGRSHVLIPGQSRKKHHEAVRHNRHGVNSCRGPRDGVRPGAARRVASAPAARVRHVAGAVAGRRDEDVRHAARLPRRAGRERAADPGSRRHRLGCRRPPVGDRDARLHDSTSRPAGEHEPLGPRRRPRGHQRRRPDGQADRLRRRPRAAARAEGAANAACSSASRRTCG